MKPPDTKPKTEEQRPMLKMKELVDATGVAKSTILLYAKKGLLPTPVKTSPNMAYYHPLCIDRIAFIKKIQSTHRLPLAAIKGLIREMEKERDVSPLLELQSMLFAAAGEKMALADFANAAGLTVEQVRSLCAMELIIPVEKELFDGQDLELARQLKSCMERGMELESLGFYPEFAKKIVAAEIRLRESCTQDLDFGDNAALTLELTRMARGLRAYVIDRTLQKELIGFKGLKNRGDK
ncbi:MAG: MerR family transcriptional regulator [Desulfobacteraceae bacterium]